MLAAKMAKPQQVGVPASEASVFIGLLGAIIEPIVFCLAFSMMTYLRTNMNTDTKEIGYKTVAKLPEYLLYVVQAQAQPEKLTTTQIMWVLQA